MAWSPHLVMVDKVIPPWPPLCCYLGPARLAQLLGIWKWSVPHSSPSYFWNGRCKLWPPMNWKEDWSLKKGKARRSAMFLPEWHPQAPGDPCVLATNENSSLFCVNYPKWFRELVTKGDLSNIVVKSSRGFLQLLWGPMMRECRGCKQWAELMKTWPHGESCCALPRQQTLKGGASCDIIALLWTRRRSVC